MKFSTRCAQSLLCSMAIVFTACGSTEQGANSAGPTGAEGVQTLDTTSTTSDGNLDMSTHSYTIHQMTAEMVNLMEDVHQKKIMSPPLKVSDVRNAFMERLDWIDDMSAEDVGKLQQATADLDTLIAEIRSHENAIGDASLEARLTKIEEWNRSIKEGLPK